MAALLEIQDLVRAGLYIFTRHALDGMRAQGIRSSEVLDVILDARACMRQRNGRYRFEGTRLRVIVAVRGDVVVVTAHLLGGDS